ncbi:hypothetical protein ACFLSA_00425 [Bacteroidota bacterium]
MTKIGILGYNPILIEHITSLKFTSKAEITGFYCFDKTPVQKTDDLIFFDDPDFLIQTTDLILVLNEHENYFDLLKTAVKKSRHLFIDDVLNYSTEQISELLKLADEAGCIIQNRNDIFNREFFRNQIHNLKKSRIITIHHNSTPDINLIKSFSKLIFKDILALFHIINSGTKKIFYNGLKTCNKNYIDYFFSYIEFNNGCTVFMKKSLIHDYELYIYEFAHFEHVIHYDLIENESITSTVRFDNSIQRNNVKYSDNDLFSLQLKNLIELTASKTYINNQYLLGALKYIERMKETIQFMQ